MPVPQEQPTKQLIFKQNTIQPKNFVYYVDAQTVKHLTLITM